jgi:Tol biopolymer transport system component
MGVLMGLGAAIMIGLACVAAAFLVLFNDQDAPPASTPLPEATTRPTFTPLASSTPGTERTAVPEPDALAEASPTETPVPTAIPPTPEAPPTDAPLTPEPSPTEVPPTAEPTLTPLPTPGSPGGIVAFESDRAGTKPDGSTNYEIFAVNADGSNPWNFSNYPDGDDTTPAWSHDGTKLAFTSYREDTNGDGQKTWSKDWGSIYVANRDGSGAAPVTDSSTNDQWPSWSPDGSRIAFQSNRDGEWEIYAVNADASNQVNLTQNPAKDRYPSWSPDGSRIAFTSNRSGYNDIYTMNADGSDQRCVTCFGGKIYDDQYADWLPDGRIIFNSNREGNSGVFVMNADGSNQSMIGSVDRDYTLPSSAAPDGSRILFYARRGGSDKEVRIMNFDGSNEANLSQSPASDEFCDWAP